ncbi:MAG: lysophospholipid acyltransferase family protein [Elusimicrobiota bacterium]|jgi:KDO2-lipid IV(A) lauroyltransferase|nr:lysophospholipid acyltransferase family protein [Elusimicrobiota bacterium]
MKDLKIIKRDIQDFMRYFRRRVYYVGALFFSKLVLLIPYKLIVHYGSKFIGWIAYFVTRDSSDIAKRQLKSCFPDKSAQEIEKITRNIFVNEAKNFFELANFPKLKGAFFDKISSVENSHLIKESLKKGKGVLIVSAHAGNWEITAAAVARLGVPVNVVAKKIYIDGLNNMLVNYRLSKNVKVILKDSPDTARKLLKALKNGEIIAMLIDQDTNVPSVFVDFFGKPAWTPSGLASLALKRGTDVLAGIDKRVGKYAHNTIITGPIVIEPSGNFDKDVINLTQKASLVLEEHIRQYPDQWVWFHERWKTQKPL